MALLADAQLIELKDGNPCDQVAGRYVRLRRHDDQRIAERVGFNAAVERLDGTRAIDAKEVERRERRAWRERDHDAYRERERGKLFEAWRRAAPIVGTSAEVYLQLRGVTAPAGARLRCIKDIPYYASGAKDAAVVHRGPALLVPHSTAKTAKRRAQRVPGPVPDLAAPGIPIPASVTRLVIIGDSTSARFMTECAGARATARWAAEGRAIVVAWAPAGQDFDDVLRLAVDRQATCGAIVYAIDAAGAPPAASTFTGGADVAAPAPRRQQSNRMGALRPSLSILSLPLPSLCRPMAWPPIGLAMRHRCQLRTMRPPRPLPRRRRAAVSTKQPPKLADYRSSCCLPTAAGWGAERSRSQF